MKRFVLTLLFFVIVVFNLSAQKLLPPSEGVYHGAFPDMGPTEDVVTIQRINEFTILTGKKPVWVYFSDNWFDGIHFPWDETEAIREAGSIPFVRMMPRIDWTEDQPSSDYKFMDIIEGKYDLDLHQYARDVKGFGTPLFIEFGTEVNGHWFPWSGSFQGELNTDYGDPNLPDGPERFRDAYRHIVEIFREERVTNATWFFHVNYSSVPDEDWNRMEQYYPGDNYVDWIGVSVYGPQVPGDEWSNFNILMDDVYSELAAVSKNKPLAILEFGAIEDSKEVDLKATWIKSVLNSITSGQYPRIKAISYWHSSWENEDGSISNMRLDSSPESLEVYRGLISNEYFITEPLF